VLALEKAETYSVHDQLVATLTEAVLYLLRARGSGHLAAKYNELSITTSCFRNGTINKVAGDDLATVSRISPEFRPTAFMATTYCLVKEKFTDDISKVVFNSILEPPGPTEGLGCTYRLCPLRGLLSGPRVVDISQS
jgi:hypothetical protein